MAPSSLILAERRRYSRAPSRACGSAANLDRPLEHECHGLEWGVSITDSGIPELDLTYFFTKNIAAELVLGVTPHTVNGSGGITSFGKVGDAWLLPPTLTLQYHFDTGTAFKPYVGGGVNYTIFFDESTGPNYSSFKLDNAGAPRCKPVSTTSWAAIGS